MIHVPTAEVAASGTVETQVVKAEQALRVRVTCHDAHVLGPNDGRTLHLLAPTGAFRTTESASLVVVDGRSDDPQVSHDVLRATVQEHPVPWSCVR